MPRRALRRVEFVASVPGAVLADMADLRREADGWINLLPGVDEEDDQPEGQSLFSVFGTRRQGVTMATWMPPRPGRRGGEVVHLGIAHSAGDRVGRFLATAGHPVPGGWRVDQDHPRRGLIVLVPPAELDEEVLAWALAATAALCTRRLTGSWQAEVYLPPGRVDPGGPAPG